MRRMKTNSGHIVFLARLLSVGDGVAQKAEGGHSMIACRKWVLVGRIVAWSLVASCAVAVAAAQNDHWVGTWAIPLQGVPPQKITVKNQTVRHRLEISVGGPRLRIGLSNEYGATPLVIGAASVAIANPDGYASVKPGTFAKVNFGGAPQVTIPRGAWIMSDPVELKTEALQKLAVSLYLPEETVLSTYHRVDVRPYVPVEEGGRGYLASTEPTLEGAVLSAEGDFTATPEIRMPAEEVRISPPFLSAIDTVGPTSTRVVVILGETKAKGPDMWPNYLRRRISRPSGGSIAVVNQAQQAGTLTLYQPYGTALTRFDRDVLTVPGATHVLFSNGSNDVHGMGRDTPPIEAIILAMKQVIMRSHAAGLKVIGTTLVPFEGVVAQGYATPEHLRLRNEVNAWIRTSGAFDAVVDFDAIVRDPTHPERLLPAMDGGNHRTPSEAGMRAIANAIKVELFK